MVLEVVIDGAGNLAKVGTLASTTGLSLSDDGDGDRTCAGGIGMLIQGGFDVNWLGCGGGELECILFIEIFDF